MPALGQSQSGQPIRFGSRDEKVKENDTDLSPRAVGGIPSMAEVAHWIPVYHDDEYVILSILDYKSMNVSSRSYDLCIRRMQFLVWFCNS
jgi:hypothetical protein